MKPTPVSTIASAVFSVMELAIYEGRLAGGMIILAADGLRVKLAQADGDEIRETEFPLSVSEIAAIHPGKYDEYARACVASGVQHLDKKSGSLKGPLGIVR